MLLIHNLYDSKMSKCLHNCIFLLRCTLWLSRILWFCQIEVLTNIQTTFLLNLCNIQWRNLQSCLLQYISLYLLISCFSPKSISSREKSTFTFLLSTIPLESKTTVSTCVDRVIEMHFPEFSLYSGSEKCCNPLWRGCKKLTWCSLLCPCIAKDCIVF